MAGTKHKQLISKVENKSSVNSVFFQPKLTINQPNDVYEKEADAMADKVMRMEQPGIQLKPFSISALQRKCEACKQEDEEKKIQLKEITPVSTPIVQRESYDVDESNCTATLNWDLGCFFQYNNETREGWTPQRQTAFINAAKPAVENGFNSNAFRIVPQRSTYGGGWFRQIFGAPSGLMDAAIPCPCSGGFIPRVNLNVSDSGVNASVDWHSMVYANSSGQYRQSSAAASDEVFGDLDEADVQIRSDGVTQIPIVHEFGHSIGLDHPGEGIAGADEYEHSGNDREGNAVDGTVDTMGEGMGLRPFYFNRWKDYLNSEYSGCNFQITTTPPSTSTPVAVTPAGGSAVPVQRQCDKCEEEKKLQRKDTDGEEKTKGYDFENYIGSLGSTGQSLPNEVRNFYEPRFGYDFSNVKVHTDSVAAKSAQSINALAYTSGSNIVFNNGQFSPNTDSGKKLLGHELTHVVQQGIQTKVIQLKPLPADLKLPCIWGDYQFTETTIENIRLLSTTDKEKPLDTQILTSIAKQIKTDNALIADKAFQVKVCIMSPGVTTRFTILNDEPVLALDLADVNVETVRHEMGHAIFNFLNNNRKHKIHSKIESENWLVTLTDIFLQLNALTFKKDGSTDEIYANNIVDPSIWKPGSKAEHPGDVDEFFGSAKEAYQTDKKALKAAFEKYGKQNKKIKELGERLFSLLDFIFSKSELKSKNISSPTAEISDHIKHLSKPSKMEDTLASSFNIRVRMLLDPAERPRCK